MIIAISTALATFIAAVPIMTARYGRGNATMRPQVTVDASGLAWQRGRVKQQITWRIAFANGNLELSGTKPGYDVFATAPGFYQDAVVTVTATQRGTVTDTSGDGVGLVLREGDNGSDFLMFKINHSGNWAVYHYHYVDQVSSDKESEPTASRHPSGCADRRGARRTPALAFHIHLWYHPCREQKDVQEPVTLLSPTAILDALRILAKDHQRSLVGEIIRALRQSITQHEQERTS